MKIQPYNVVCFGGGTGLPSLLTGLKKNPLFKITAVANMFDTGGSSGELRDKFGILPPGDVLKCLLALSEDEAVARKILLKRINHQKFIPGHTGGNLLLFALEKVYGDYLDAVNALGHILSAKGRVVPVTLTSSTLVAHYKSGRIEKGETDVDKGVYEGDEIEELSLEPQVPACEDVLKAIREADIFCIGPGSFYTSIMPNFLPDGVREALHASTKPVIYVANLLTEGKGMAGYTVAHMTERIEQAIGRKVSAVVVNSKLPSDEVLANYAVEQKFPIACAKEGMEGRVILEAELWRDAMIARHDSDLLASVVADFVSRANA